MRALRFAVVAALISVSVVESSSAFARAAGGAGAGAGAGAAGSGASGSAAGGGGGAPELAVINPIRVPPRFRPSVPAPQHYGACYKEEHLYDRFGDAIINLHGVECFGG